MVPINIARVIKKSFDIKKYPTADRNAHLIRILFQGIPYLFSNNGFSFPPLSVFIHVNTQCNLKCKMCDAGQQAPESNFYKNLKGGTEGDMPIRSFKNIIEKIKRYKPFVGIPATEPLLYPYISEGVEYIIRQGLRCSIATNGTLLKDKAKDLVNSGLTKLVVSIDGPERVHDKIRGVSGTYKKAISGIIELAELKKSLGKKEPYIFVNYVVSEDNYSVLRECIKDLPLDVIQQIDIRLMFYCTQDLAIKHNKIFGPRYDATTACLSGGINLYNIDTESLYKEAFNLNKYYADKCKFFFSIDKAWLKKYFHEPEVFFDATRCVFPWYTMQINNDGNVIPPQRCYHNIFGNILQQNFKEIWNGKRMMEFRKDLRKYGRFPACARCEGVNF